VIKIRYLINLDNKKKQISALKEIYKTLKKGGTYLMCENFNENLENLNKLRKKFNLDKIKTRWHNKYLSNKEIKDYATKKLKFKILEERNFASSYYFLTRVVKPYLFKINDKKLQYNDSFNTLASKFDSFGEFSPMKLIILKK